MVTSGFLIYESLMVIPIFGSSQIPFLELMYIV